jgi:ABC-type polysaccharide/polyol phosphate export permease
MQSAELLPPALPFAQTTLHLRRYVEIVRVLAARNLKARYRGSILGVYWSLSNPLIMTAIYTALFGSAFSAYYHGKIANYMLSCFTGLAVLNFFSATTTQALPSIVSSGSLLNKLRLPFSAFPVSVVVANAFQYVVGVLPLLAIVTLYSTHKISHVLFLVVPSVALLLISTGFSLATSTLFVYFRDLPYLYELVVFLLWITSPIFYPQELVPEKLRPYVLLNPLAVLITSVRTIAFNVDRPNMSVLGLSLLSGAACLGIGAVIFARGRKAFMDLL